MTTLNVKNIEAELNKFLVEEWGVELIELKRETSFVNDLNADSLDLVEMVMDLEDKFDIVIPDEEANKIQTVGQAIDFIASELQKKQE